jgi:iron complex outermembrane receptor protein
VGVKNKISDHLWWRLRYSRQSSADYKVPASSFTYLGRTLPLDQGILNNTAGQENQFTGYLKRQKAGRKFELLARWYSQHAGMFPGVIGVPTLLAVTSDGLDRNVSLPAAEVVHVTIQGAYKSTLKNGYWESNLGMQENTRKELSYAHKGQPEVDDTLAHQLSLKVYQLHVLRFWEWRGWAFKSGMQSSFFDHKRKGFEFLLPNYRQWNQGVFFQSEGPMGHAGWTLSAGLRFDAGGFDSQEGFAWTWLSGESNYTYIQRSTSVHQFFHAWSGAVGGFKTNSDKRMMKWNVARSFRMPQGAELTINGIHHGTFRHEMGNSELNPEQGIQADALWMETQGDWSWKLSPFYSYFSNYIYLSPQAQFSPMAEGGQVYAYLQHRVVLTGGEAWFEWKPAPWGHWDGAVEYVYTYNVDTQLPLPFIPPLQFKSSWEGEWEKEEWSGAFQIQWVKAMAQNAVDRNVKPTPGYQLVHGGGTLTHQSNGYSWSINVRVINAFNAYYLSNMSMYRTLNLPEQGRMVQLTLTLNINSKK